MKLFNSRTCQLVLGAGAVNVAGLKTITIRSSIWTLMCKCNLIQEPGGHSSKSEFGVRSDPGHAPAPSCLPLTLGQAGGHLGKVNLAQILLFMKSLEYLE